MRVTDGQSRKTYRVRWEIDIDADTPLQAAKRAQVYQRSRDSLATVYQVYERLEPVKMEEIDLGCICGYDEERNPVCAVHGSREKLTT